MNAEQYGDAFNKGFEYTKRFLGSKGVDSQDAEEFSQAAWARGWEYVSQLKDSRMVFSWVNTIAIRMLAGAKRGSDKRIDQLDSEPVFENIGTDAHHAKIELAKVIRLCTKRDRILLTLQLHGFTPKEISRNIDITETAVRVKFLRSRRSARERFERNSETRRKIA